MSKPAARGMPGNSIVAIPPLVCAGSERRWPWAWCMFVGCACLRMDVSGSRTGDGELSLTLQEGSVGVDELVRLDITNRDTGHVGSICRESESSGVEGAGVVEVARSLSPNEDIERDFRALLASVAGARALGSTFRRSRDIKCKSCR